MRRRCANCGGRGCESDGLRYHRTPSTQARDARRDRAHVLAGMTPLLFTHHEIKYKTLSVASDIDHT